ncbi:evasin P1180-like isoform X2 [Amblyomma americanum]
MKTILYLVLTCTSIKAQTNVPAFDINIAIPGPVKTTGSCAFHYLSNGNEMKPAGCRIECPGRVDTIADGATCYALPSDFILETRPSTQRMCPVGVCDTGVCKPTGKYELCANENTEKPK